MKISLVFIPILALVLVASSCKYKEGPIISFRTKTARVANKWKVDKITKNGDQLKGAELADFMFGEPRIWEFTKDGKASFVYDDGGTETGTWVFEDKKKNLTIVTDGGDETVHKIIKLKNNEMWLEDSFGGDKYVTYLITA